LRAASTAVAEQLGRVSVGAETPAESRRAQTYEVGDKIVARGAVQARRAETVVDVGLAQNTFEAERALAQEVVDVVDAASAVETRTRDAVVNILLTH